MEVPYKGLIKYVGIPAVIFGVACAIYYSGYNNGANAIKAERAADVAAQELVIAELNGKISAKEEVHGQETAKLRAELASAKDEYSAVLSRNQRDYADGLRLSEQRADRYRAIADSNPAQCRGLASHAAGLDRSIVEGQDVVKDLIGTLELRDTQLRVLGSQILSDRQLYENNGTDRN